jgi:RNA polymerase sigma factor (sigma-70 family)
VNPNDISEESLQAWFMREVLSHEPTLTRLISRLWRYDDDRADFRQEVYARVFEAARKAKPRSPRAFLFATARHLICDQGRRRQILSMQTGGIDEYTHLFVDEVSPERLVSAGSDLNECARAFERLPYRRREVLWLRRIHELSQQEVAKSLGVSEKAVEKHLRLGARQLVEVMREFAE